MTPLSKKVTPLSRFEEVYPLSWMHFSSWAMKEYALSTDVFLKAAPQHQYIITARFFGYSLSVPPDLCMIDLIAEIGMMFKKFENALRTAPKIDPITTMCNMPWEKRNKLNEELFKRQTHDTIASAIIPLDAVFKPTIAGCFIPVSKAQNLSFTGNISGKQDQLPEEMFIPITKPVPF